MVFGGQELTGELSEEGDKTKLTWSNGAIWERDGVVEACTSPENCDGYTVHNTSEEIRSHAYDY